MHGRLQTESLPGWLKRERSSVCDRWKKTTLPLGAYLRRNTFDRWPGGVMSGLNHHVKYVHTKYMLIDPLGRNPIVVSGSSNFSEASTTKNDENLLVIRGNRRAADVYLGEFMRLYSRYAFREWVSRNRRDRNTTPKHLRTDDWWRDYFGTSARSRQRAYFAG
jgi:phosphatidylserine/phosphatidylglycerophosphate/cardiolipin synthase-like enzyme